MPRTWFTPAVVALLLSGHPSIAQAQGSSSAATLDVTGGPMAGRHTLVAPDIGCFIYAGSAKMPKRFSVNFGLPPTDPRSRDLRALTFVLVTIRDARGAGPIPETQYDVSITFGPVGDHDRETFYMSGTNPTVGRTGGRGVVILKDLGANAEVQLDVQPTAGVSIKGKLSCTNVIRT